MAMGQRGQQEAVSAFRRQVRYASSTGNLYATPGSTRELGWLRSHPEAEYIKDLLSRAEYIVWSYRTPIGFVSLDDGEVQRFIVEVKHTATTSHHQSLLRYAWGEYTVVGSRQVHTRARRQAAPAPQRRITDGYTPDFTAQDDLMDEVRGWRSPSHP